MNQTLHFIIPGVPVAQPRARATAIGGHARMYEAKKEHAIHTFKATARLAAKERFWGEPMTGPVMLSVQFVFPRPKRLQRKKDPTCRIRKWDKPDLDNALKAVMDALNEVVWKDDQAICQVSDLSKWYAAVGEEPKTVVMVVTRGPTP